MDGPIVRPQVGAEVWALRPDLKAISIIATGVVNHATHPHTTHLLAEACRELNRAPWADDHVEAWREAFRGFGAKPKKTPSSLEALRSRAAKVGQLPSINSLVDLYNAVSVRFALPVGGEDLDAYVGQPRLVRASGTETFDTVREGIEVVEAVDPGEVIWRDDRGATCRRWNWRQCNRTRITTDSSQIWFVLEALGPMPDDILQSAAMFLCDNLAAINPLASLTVNRLS